MEVFEYVKGLSPGALYLFLAFSAWLENIFPPIPGDTITALGAFFVASGRLSFLGVFLASTIGSTVGFFTLFLLGKHLGREFFIRKDLRYFPKELIFRAEERYKRHGYLVVALNRFLPGVRSVISVAGGIVGLKSSYVIVLSLISASCWNLIWIYAGFLFGKNWIMVKEGVMRLMKSYNAIVGTLILVVVVFIFVKKYKKSK